MPVIFRKIIVKDGQVSFIQILLKQIRKVTKILPVGIAVFYAGTRSERLTDSTEVAHANRCTKHSKNMKSVMLGQASALNIGVW